MRLIDADSLIEQLKECLDDSDVQKSLEFFGVYDVINEQPTAYDVERVCEQINTSGQKMAEAKANMPYGKSTPGCHNYYKAISVKKATEIIRKGGVNE